MGESPGEDPLRTGPGEGQWVGALGRSPCFVGSAKKRVFLSKGSAHRSCPLPESHPVMGGARTSGPAQGGNPG